MKKLDRLILHVESLIFSAHQPIKVEEIRKALEDSMNYNPVEEEVNAALEFLTEKYRNPDFSFEIVEIDHGYLFLSKSTYHKTIGSFLKISSPRRLSKAALETLAIIAYKQPVTKSEIEKIRGVNCDYTIQKLLDKDLVSIIGRNDGPGRPLLYATSDRFMDYFGLKSMNELPKLKDFNIPESEIGDSSTILEEAIRNTNEN